MINYFPELYPDELVYSWFCRYYVHSGVFSHKAAMQELYCKRSDNPSKEFVGNLKPAARKRIEELYPMEELIMEHTMFKQYAKFIPLEKKKETLNKLKDGVCDVHTLFSAVPRAEGERYLKYCPICSAEDRKKYGEAYWHRKHQIRSMSICTKHRCELQESDVIIKIEQTFTFCPAENHIKNIEPCFADNTSKIQFATYIDRVFDAPMDLEKDIPLSAILYYGMEKTKYLKSTGKSRYTKMLADDMREYYEKMKVCSPASMYQIQRVLLGSRFDFSVTCQLAFFLGMSAEELTKPTLTLQQIEREQNSHYMKAADDIDWEKLDAETLPLLEQLARGVYDGTANENGRPERISERMIYREFGLSQHRLDNMPKCKAVIKQYTESYPESWARKIIWAYKKLQEDGEKIYWSDIRQLTGVKKINLELVIPFLKKHGDVVTANEIIAIVAG